MALTQEDIERIRCSSHPINFAKYAKVQEEGVGAIPFDLPDHAIQIIDLVWKNKYSCLLKARQIYASWCMALIATCYCYYHPSALVLVTSQNEDKAAAFLDKVKFIHENLPDFLRMTTGSYGMQKVTFPAMNSKIIALPSTQTASIGEHASLVIMDEADFHEYATQYFNMGKPTIDKGDSKMVMLSTINPEKQDTLFKEICRASMDNRGQFSFMFVPWNVLKYRTKKWLDQVCDNEYTVAGMSKELYKATQYPSDAQEALKPPSAIAAFDHDVLYGMKRDVEKPVTEGVINIYRHFVVGHTYTAFTDTSEGTGRDESVTVVYDMNTGYVVADIQDSLLGPEDIAYYSYQMLEKYRFPLWGIENNKRGYATVNKAIELGYKNIFYEDWQKDYKRDESKKTKPGWNNGPTQGDNRHRSLLWNEGIYAVSTGQIKILSERGLNSFFSVVRNPSKSGRVEGLSGTHDDYPMAVCGAWQMTKFVTKPSRGPSAPISLIGRR